LVGAFEKFESELSGAMGRPIPKAERD
jgi:hypothetical protein